MTSTKRKGEGSLFVKDVENRGEAVIARARASAASEITLDLGKLNAKQIEFFKATTKFTCYGGA